MGPISISLVRVGGDVTEAFFQVSFGPRWAIGIEWGGAEFRRHMQCVAEGEQFGSALPAVHNALKAALQRTAMRGICRTASSMMSPLAVKSEGLPAVRQLHQGLLQLWGKLCATLLSECGRRRIPTVYGLYRACRILLGIGCCFSLDNAI